MCRTAIPLGQLRELCRQMAHCHIVWYIGSIRGCNRLPARFCAAQLPATFFASPLIVRFSTRDSRSKIYLQTGPSVVPFDFQTLHLEPLKDDHRQRQSCGVTRTQDTSRGVAQFRDAFSNLADRWFLVLRSDDDALRNLKGSGCNC